ncbi:hypothetical protein SAMN05443634_10513 [Chishuiella changwenlii]|uniref:Outer membrane protein beta-barrel domain-containing protein n=1 Tax=Chishuiella changwenlii TaxID=1434701 RepID=A0A1M6WW98_9FLAO|nr:hypothetical protein [Chishuiella changwenlii]GGE98931.1 hypothetical protein GCM10010984_15630 [Chishuiella changwenlii]SHK97993.1 hypothetical protein SAMN05443634_10513 [Chishuiella changwenlii]
MKKILLYVALLFISLSNVNAQEGHFKAGTHLGFPVGKLSDNYSFNLGIDVAYLWKLNNITELGITTGFSNYFGKTVSASYWGYTFNSDIKDVQIIPLAATAKFNIANDFFIGTDLGYAFFLDGGDETGAFYFQPKVGLDFKKSELYLSYKGMSKNGNNIGSVNLGYAYNF